MDILTLNLFVWLTAYLIGNLSLSYCWLKYSQKSDLRNMGSGSLGARNTGRYLGKKGFILTLLFDIAKGSFAVYIATLFIEDPAYIYPTAILVTAGHIWPVLLGFKGGKGIATSLGAFAVIDINIVLVIGILSLCLYLLTHKFTRSGLLAYILSPLILVTLQTEIAILLSVTICNVLVLWAHRANIKDEINLLRERPNEQRKNH